MSATPLPQRIGLNLLYLVPGAVGGSEIYARELIRELGAALPDQEFIAFCVREATESLEAEDWPANVSVREVGVDGSNKPRRAATEMFVLPRIAKKAGVGLLHSLGNTAPPWGDHVRVVTVLDLIYHHYPETIPPLARRGLEFLVPLGARHADRVTTISQATKNDLVATYRIDPDKVDPVLLGLGQTRRPAALPEAELRAKYELGSRPVILCIAHALAHKNVPRLFDALAQQFPNGTDSPMMVVVGHAGLEQDKLRDHAVALNIGDRVRFTGWIDQGELEGLFELATLFAYPTLLEGFGLPVLEAMERGVPVACSNTTSLPEVAGDAAELFDPTDTAAIGAAMARIIDNPELRASLIKRGHERAAEFTWQRTALGTIDVYRAAIEARSGHSPQSRP